DFRFPDAKKPVLIRSREFGFAHAGWSPWTAEKSSKGPNSQRPSVVKSYSPHAQGPFLNVCRGATDWRLPQAAHHLATRVRSTAGPAPALEPLGTLDQQANLRREIAAAQEGTQKRIAQLEGANLAIDDRKTLGDARAFLAQSTRALENGELGPARLLAHKAALLVQAVEQSH